MASSATIPRRCASHQALIHGLVIACLNGRIELRIDLGLEDRATLKGDGTIEEPARPGHQLPRGQPAALTVQFSAPATTVTARLAGPALTRGARCKAHCRPTTGTATCASCARWGAAVVTQFAVNSPSAAATAISEALQLWCFGQVDPTPGARPGEPPPAPHASAAFAAAGGIGTHGPDANHTYMPYTAALTEGVLMADQLARSST